VLAGVLFEGTTLAGDGEAAIGLLIAGDTDLAPGDVATGVTVSHRFLL